MYTLLYTLLATGVYLFGGKIGRVLILVKLSRATKLHNKLFLSFVTKVPK
jgi:hypothetical protein